MTPRFLYLESFPLFRQLWSDLHVTHDLLHLLDAGVGVDVVVVGHLVAGVGVGVAAGGPAPAAQLPEHQAQAVHVSHLPAVEHRLVDGLVQQLRRHVALGPHLVVEGDVHLAVVK